MFETKDIELLQQRGISEQEAMEQLRRFEEGFPWIPAVKPAVAGDGIICLSSRQVEDYGKKYEESKTGRKILKFVPASGAATRMFKSIFESMQDFNRSDEAFPEYLEASGKNDVAEVLSDYRSFAFAPELERLLSLTGHTAGSPASWLAMLKCLLDENGLNYGSLPKGLLLFHSYQDGPRTAAEEHMVEAALYAATGNNQAFIHFTVSPEHEAFFSKLVSEKKAFYEKKFGVDFEISFSCQKPSTDTLAADMENRPFREPDGSMLFRPGGHGALLANLNELPADVIFIKNIDNVVPDHLKKTTVEYKKALAGLMLGLQKRIFEYLSDMEMSGHCNGLCLEEIRKFLEQELYVVMPDRYDQMGNEEKREFLRNKLHRPLRVCGMVRNEGEPGGGPFWVWSNDGSMQLQIVESSQFNLKEPEQKKIFENATHFNPVDLVCSTINYRGEPFDLKGFIDRGTGFISRKSKDGRDLKALELPGLWNGSMAGWNTVFVEVPIDTFRPVKTINDLLRKEHIAV